MFESRRILATVGQGTLRPEIAHSGHSVTCENLSRSSFASASRGAYCPQLIAIDAKVLTLRRFRGAAEVSPSAGRIVPVAKDPTSTSASVYVAMAKLISALGGVTDRFFNSTIRNQPNQS